MAVKFNRYNKIKMKDEPHISKTPILIFVFFLNIMIMIVMGVIVWNENLFVADRVVDFCYFVFLVNIFICAIYIVIILLFVIKIILEGGGISWNKITPKSFTKLSTAKPETDEPKIKKKVKFLDIIKDPAVIFSVLFLVFAVLTFVFYFTMSPWYFIVISVVLAICTGILFLIRTKDVMMMTFKIFVVFLSIFLAIFIFTVIWNRIN